MKKQIEQQALKMFNELSKTGTSYRSCLQSMYESASEKKQYERCNIIAELIADDINEDNY